MGKSKEATVSCYCLDCALSFRASGSFVDSNLKAQCPNCNAEFDIEEQTNIEN